MCVFVGRGGRRQFNVTRFLSERSGEARIYLAMLEFSNYISKQGLMDISLVGGSFTWSNNRAPPSRSRIDRFLVSLEWQTQFPDLL